MTAHAPEELRPRHLVTLLLVAVTCFGIGMALVYFGLRPTAGGRSEPAPAPPKALERTATPAPPAAPDAVQAAAAPSPPPQSAAPATKGEPPLAAGPKPAHLNLDPPRVTQCWKEDGTRLEAAACDAPEGLSVLLAQRLYAVAPCLESALLPVSFTLELDFTLGRTTAFETGDAEAARRQPPTGCIGEKWRSLPLDDVRREFARYRVHVTIRPVAGPDAAPDAAVAGATGENAGREVAVTKTKVRVRKAPVDGDPIGMISRPNTVRLLDREDDWCKVRTPNSNVGWMICDALDL